MTDMKKLVYIFVVSLTLWLPLRAQVNDPYDRRGVQFAAEGTDFWVCFPRTIGGDSPNMSRLYVVSERDCDVTVSSPLIGYSQTAHIMRREMCDADTNYIDIPYSIGHFLDTFHYNFPVTYDESYVGRQADLPQPRGFHVTSTDTVSLFLWIRCAGLSAATNVLPTEMLRDEYIAQTPLTFREAIPHTPPPPNIVTMTTNTSTIDIVAVEDSTVVDIVLSDWDWTNRHPGDTITVTLMEGEMYHVCAGKVREKFYPKFEPYYHYYSNNEADPVTADTLWAPGHSFEARMFPYDTFIIDLSGTRIKARDCKRIAVFEGGGPVYIPLFKFHTFDMLLDQSLPIKYSGQEYLVPNVDDSDTDYVRITGLHDGTVITIRDGSRTFGAVRTLHVDAGKTEWFSMYPNEGPFYITTSQPVLMKEYVMRGANMILDHPAGDPAFSSLVPVEWWVGGQINYGTITDVDAQHNMQTRWYSLYVFARTTDVSSMWIDGYCVESYFVPIAGTQYSYAHFDHFSSFNSRGTHRIRSTTGSKFMAMMASTGPQEQALFNLPHMQPGNVYLTVNGIPADSLKEDSIWCMYDPITFNAWDERPADSVFWDFGDGTTLAFSHLDDAFYQQHVHTYQDTGKYRVRCIFTYEYDSCYTLENDTLWASIWIHNHYDSSFAVHLCEGTYTFRGNLLDYTDTFYITTYWTPSGCDTLWQIDFVTCPHCTWDYDTVSPDELPMEYNGYTFGSEVHDERVLLDIGEDCDSIIFYTLIVIPNWGEPPLDSVFILAPNVITPKLETNNRFSLVCSHHILKAEVSIFNRMGTKVAQFDGLTDSWDGTSEGRICHQGTYAYYVRYIDINDNSWKTFTGTVTLIY